MYVCSVDESESDRKEGLYYLILFIFLHRTPNRGP